MATGRFILRSIPILAAILSICALTVAELSGQMVVYVEWSPPPATTDQPESTPTAEDRDAQQRLRTVSDLENHWTFELPSDEGRLVTAILLRLEPAPDDYEFEPIEVRLPATERHKVTTVYLAPYRPEAGSRPIRELYGTNLGRISEERLPILYQRAATLAQLRIEGLGQWSELHDYDVQAVYKYLQAAWELTTRTYVVPLGAINRAKDWLATAVERQPRRVGHAVGMANAADLLRKIDQMEGKRFERLWRVVQGVQIDERYALLQQYDDLFREVPSSERRARIEEVTRVPRGIVLSSMAEALVHVVKRHLGDLQVQRRRLVELAEMIRSELGAAPGSIRGKLRSDIEVLEELAEAIVGEEGAPGPADG